jgi:hypothetical protein
MIIATAGAATSAACTASKLPEVAGPGLGVFCAVPVAGLPLAVAPGRGVELVEGVGIESEQALARSSPLKPESMRVKAGLAVALLSCMDSCGSR